MRGVFNEPETSMRLSFFRTLKSSHWSYGIYTINTTMAYLFKSCPGGGFISGMFYNFEWSLIRLACESEFHTNYVLIIVACQKRHQSFFHDKKYGLERLLGVGTIY